MYRGILTVDDGRAYLRGPEGERFCEDAAICDGYLMHWQGKDLHARFLKEPDYETGAPVLIMWPAVPVSKKSFAELYLNERLIKYPASFLGHAAININGGIYNFSHLINESFVKRLKIL